MNTSPVPGGIGPSHQNIVRRPDYAPRVHQHSSHTEGHHTTNVFIVGEPPVRDAYTRIITPEGEEQGFGPPLYGSPEQNFYQDYGTQGQRAYDYPEDAGYPPNNGDDGWVDVAAPARRGPSKKALLGIGAVGLAVVAVAALAVHWVSGSGAPTPSPPTVALPAPSSAKDIRSPSQALLGIEELRALVRPTDPSAPDSTSQLALVDSTDKAIGDAVDPATCSGVWTPASAQVYSMLPVRDMRTDIYGSGGWTGPHVVETVALLPDAESAQRAATSVARGWTPCGGSAVSVLNLPPTSQTITLSVQEPVQDVVSTLSWSVPDTQWSCQRAVTAEGNALIDVRSCGQQLNTSAKPIAERIAQHVRVA